MIGLMNILSWQIGCKCGGLPEMTFQQPEEVANVKSSVNRKGL